MEDFLSLPPELTYESYSEKSNSPSSHHEGNLTQANDWMNWELRDEDIAFADDPLFALEHQNALGQDSGLDFPLDNATITTSTMKSSGPEFIITPEMLRDVLDAADAPEITHSVAPPHAAGGTKRKISSCSLEECSDGQESSTSQIDRPAGEAEQSAKDAASAPKKRSTGPRPPKVSHNVIEKRYRSNLNDKILELRDTIPSLRIEADAGNNKHAKGRIISTATEYIRDLEARNLKLLKENNRLTTKLHGEQKTESGGTLSKVIVGGLAGMMCLSGIPSDGQAAQHTKRGLDDPHTETYTSLQIVIALVKMLLLVGAILYCFSPTLFAVQKVPKEKQLEKYSQSTSEDCLQEDVQENRELLHENVSAILEMPCSRPGLFKRIFQGCFVLILEILIGQSGWNVLINRGLDYALTRQRACAMLIETQLLGGDKYINQAKLFLSAIQSLGYRMPKEMRAIHFAMVCYGYAPTSVIQWCVSLFWTTSIEDPAVLQLPLAELLSDRVLSALWAWTTGVEDPLIANIRSDENINTPLKQLSAIHASLLQNHILRNWLRGTESARELEMTIQQLLRYSPEGSKIMTNSLYLQSMIEPSDWLEIAMMNTLGRAEVSTSQQEVAMQLRVCVLLNLLEKNPGLEEEVTDVLKMAELETSSLLPGYSSRIVASCIAKHKLDDEEGISHALRKICARIGSTDHWR